MTVHHINWSQTAPPADVSTDTPLLPQLSDTEAAALVRTKFVHTVIVVVPPRHRDPQELNILGAQ